MAGVAHRRKVVLTFDAESGSDVPDRTLGAGGWDDVLTLLRREQVPATFFMQGDWVAAHPDLARRTRDEGHLLGNHTLNHLDLARHPARITDQVETSDEVIKAVVGHSVRPWFRLPYLSGSDDPAVRGALAELGWEHVHTNADSRDWDPAVSQQDATRRVLAGVAEDKPVIAMFHTWPTLTVDVVGSVIGFFKRQHAMFTTVSELSELERMTIADRDPGDPAP